MAHFKELLLQIRYPYTAGVIAVMWLGLPALAAAGANLHLEVLIVLTAAASIFIAVVGFSSSSR